MLTRDELHRWVDHLPNAALINALHTLQSLAGASPPAGPDPGMPTGHAVPIDLSRRQLLLLLESMVDFVATADATGNLQYMNRAGRRLLEVDARAPVNDLHVADLVPRRLRSSILEKAIPALHHRGVWRSEINLLTRTNREVPVTLVGLLHRQPSGSAPLLAFLGRDNTMRKQFEDQLLYLSDHDLLTGIFNRRRFQQELERELVRARRYGGEGAVLFVDLDDFKVVNDALGHQAGDELVRQLARQLVGQLRRSDVAARLGGDEFAILLPQTGLEQAQVVAERILDSLRLHSIPVPGGPIGISASIGIARFPAHGTTSEHIMVRADLALHLAKESGNRYCIFSLDHNAEAQMSSRLAWTTRLRAALEKERFCLHAQPILNLHGLPILDLAFQRVSHYELLLRLREEDGSLTAPAAFLGVAERSGLIREIDRWVVGQAIRLAAEHRRQGRTIDLNVNLSGKALSDSGLVALIRRDLADCGVEPQRLIFEITETAAIADIAQARTFMENLKSVGCRFALDDFGVGFATLYHLKQLPVDFLKIDGTFVQNLARDQVDQHLVRAIVEAARGFSVRTIAEFVGDQKTLELLRDYGVDYAQGYHIGHPRPVAEI